MASSTDLAYRLASVDDLPFIEKTFLDSFRTSFSAGLITMPRWEQVMGQEFRTILARPDVRAVVAHHPGEQPGDCDLYGYILTLEGYEDFRSKEPLPYVVYIYVKSAYRRDHGIEDGLFDAAGIAPNQPFHYAVKTPMIARTFGSNAIWRPLPIRFPPEGYNLKSNPEKEK